MVAVSIGVPIDYVDKPDPLGLARVEQIGCEHQLLGAAQADDSRQALRPSGTRQLTEIEVTVADLSAFRGHRRITGEQEFESARDANAVDRCDIDVARRFDSCQRLKEIATEATDGSGVAVEPDELVKVAASREGPSPPADDDHDDVLLGLEGTYRRPQFLDHRPVERIEFVGPV